MKKNLHPSNYRLVVFQDEAAGFSFLTHSTADSEETIVWQDGETYPLIKIYISSASHPYFTGEEKIIDTEGRVDRFAAKMKAAAEAKAKKAAAAEAKSTKVKKPEPTGTPADQPTDAAA
jgi:large subunit ribosomal protein L31